jgi:N-methylhydantoinase A
MLMTDLRSDFTQTSITRLTADSIPVFSAVFADLDAQADAWYEAEGLGADKRQTRWLLDLRYVGQNYEISVDVPAEGITEDWIALVIASFHLAHEKRYGYSTTTERVEAATFRVEAIGSVPQAGFPTFPIESADAAAAVRGTREVYLPEFGERVSVPLYDREALRPGNVITGPAVIEQYDTTALVLPDQIATVDEYLMIVTSPVASEHLLTDAVSATFDREAN